MLGESLLTRRLLRTTKLACNKIDILDSNHESITWFNCVLHTNHVTFQTISPFPLWFRSFNSSTTTPVSNKPAWRTPNPTTAKCDTNRKHETQTLPHPPPNRLHLPLHRPPLPNPPHPLRRNLPMLRHPTPNQYLLHRRRLHRNLYPGRAHLRDSHIHKPQCVNGDPQGMDTG